MHIAWLSYMIYYQFIFYTRFPEVFIALWANHLIVPAQVKYVEEYGQNQFGKKLYENIANGQLHYQKGCSSSKLICTF